MVFEDGLDTCASVPRDEELLGQIIRKNRLLIITVTLDVPCEKGTNVFYLPVICDAL